MLLWISRKYELILTILLIFLYVLLEHLWL